MEDNLCLKCERKCKQPLPVLECAKYKPKEKK